ncbi:MAG TPA: hypothetical protein VK179_17850 [Bacteroidales bacterium]|nr:hypothetical protein [Bacteroidales bacterium]
MKKTLILSFFMLLFSGMMYSQFREFNLSDFKLPDIKRQRLDMNLNLTMNNRFDNNHVESLSHDKFNVWRLANTDNFFYGSYKNTAKLQSEQSYSLNFEPLWSRQKTESYKNTNFQLNTDISISSINRKYFSGKLFFEPDFQFSASYENDKVTSTTQTDKTITDYASVEIPLLIGKGRIEQVQDARLAIYILEDLNKQGRLSHTPDNSEILEFASFIAILKNERYFDYRLKRIEEIEKIDSFMQVKNWISKPDAAYFTTVYDNWEYADGPIRNSGKRISGGVIPEFSFSRYYLLHDFELDPDDESDSRTTGGGISAIVKYNSAKPVSLYWQRDWDADLSYSFGRTWDNEKITDSKYNYNQHWINSNIDYSLGYYPNSRTNFNVDLGLEGTLMFSKYSDYHVEKASGYIISPFLSLRANYYVSPQLRLSAYYNTGYSYSNIDRTFIPYSKLYSKVNSLYQNMNISFTYSFF